MAFDECNTVCWVNLISNDGFNTVDRTTHLNASWVEKLTIDINLIGFHQSGNFIGNFYDCVS